jgi:hypothetical protein
VRVMVPTSDALGLAWTQVDFDDAGWTAEMTGVGYDSSGSALNIDINDRSFDISTNTQPGCAVTVTISNTPPQG